MRIVGGSLSGRVLRAPKGAATRPTSEKVREAVFNILGASAVDGADVLDLFAGSGGLGIEALSRGAAHVTFVDASRQALAVLRDNLAALGLTARATVHAGDAVAFAARNATRAVGDAAGDVATPSPRDGEPARPWRLVFVDPPYASDLAVRAVTALPAERLAPDATIVIEHDRRHAPPDALGSLLRTDHRRYGDTLVSFYTRAVTS